VGVGLRSENDYIALVMRCGYRMQRKKREKRGSGEARGGEARYRASGGIEYGMTD
jgi:hypothetical protein